VEIEAIRVLEEGIDEEDSLGEVVPSVPRGMWAVEKAEVVLRVDDESAAGRTGECVRLEGILPDYHSNRRTESKVLEAPRRRSEASTLVPTRWMMQLNGHTNSPVMNRTIRSARTADGPTVTWGVARF
jgi:hypothetical protein